MPRRAGCPRAADGHGRRVTETPVAGATQYKVYTSDGQLRFNGNGSGGNRFIYLGNTLIATDNVTGSTATNRLYEHTDALGSRVARWRVSDNVLTRFSYAPYGANFGTAASGIGYTGHEGDSDTGLIYMQQRYYDPLVGRFLSVDPVAANPEQGDNFNRYWYADGNPYTLIDPDGRKSVAYWLVKLSEIGMRKVARVSRERAARAVRSGENVLVEARTGERKAARQLAKAGAGGKGVVGPESSTLKNGTDGMPHYHTSDRNGAHVFFGKVAVVATVLANGLGQAAEAADAVDPLSALMHISDAGPEHECGAVCETNGGRRSEEGDAKESLGIKAGTAPWDDRNHRDRFPNPLPPREPIW